jgi:beta-lactam-binding protein with PASTA domain
VVPKLNGKKLKAAKKLVRAADCKVGLVATKKGVKSATGKVVRQSPNAGRVIPPHSAVSLKLG